jgi:hypothetical protein
MRLHDGAPRARSIGVSGECGPDQPSGGHDGAPAPTRWRPDRRRRPYLPAAQPLKPTPPARTAFRRSPCRPRTTIRWATRGANPAPIQASARTRLAAMPLLQVRRSKSTPFGRNRRPGRLPRRGARGPSTERCSSPFPFTERDAHGRDCYARVFSNVTRRCPRYRVPPGCDPISSRASDLRRAGIKRTDHPALERPRPPKKAPPSRPSPRSFSTTRCSTTPTFGAWWADCSWELARLLNSMRGRQAARKQRQLAETSVAPLVCERAGLKGCWRLRMCPQAIRILRATADSAGCWRCA